MYKVMNVITIFIVLSVFIIAGCAKTFESGRGRQKGFIEED